MPKQKYPEPIVGALIFNKKGEIFLMKSHKWLGKYVIPGGHIELGETIEKAVKREVKEETGLEITDIEFVQLQEFIFDKNFWRKRHFIFLNYACRTSSNRTSSKSAKLNSEAQEFIWVSLEKVLTLPIEPYTRKFIETYIRKKGINLSSKV